MSAESVTLEFGFTEFALDAGEVLAVGVHEEKTIDT
ncbi:hypothetical protein SUDANB105_08211 (plasmid) [Streptomyces sp. enrichment culture]